MLSEKRVLVVEAEFLAALDLQRILEEAHAAKIVFARSLDEAASLADRFGEFDLAIIEMQRGGSQPATALVKDLLAADVAVIANSGDLSLRHSLPGYAGVPLLRRPFGELDVLTACAIALGSRPERS